MIECKYTPDDTIKEITPVKLWLCFIEDGYLYGASDYHTACYRDYWRPEHWEGTEFYWLESGYFPPIIAERLQAQGISPQYYSDGYEAETVAARYGVSCPPMHDMYQTGANLPDKEED